jgi:hypothetical protein
MATAYCRAKAKAERGAQGRRSDTSLIRAIRLTSDLLRCEAAAILVFLLELGEGLAGLRQDRDGRSRRR